jgi:hypothetical protein
MADDGLDGRAAAHLQRGGFVCSPIMSDIQDEPTRDELMKIGLTRDDAEHISQSRANNCDYFLTRDEASIIKYRDEIENRFPVKITTPVEMVGKLQSLGRLPRDARNANVDGPPTPNTVEG